MNNKYYITTTLPYVNADPHIGFAFEIIEADALARYARLLGHEVFFNTGTDEHGQKIANKADETGESRQSYVDHYAGEFQKLTEALNLSPDAFIRTTDEKHIRAAQEMWRRCNANGDIYKKKYSGLYCVGCESFKTESDLIDGKCPDHNKAPEHIEEENYFFALSKYQTYLEEYLSQEGVVVPVWRREEALNFVKQGLQDFSISREKSRLDWGIPVPDDETQVMYVWFDALTNYISTLGWPDDAEGNYKKFWEEGEPLQVAGKDQVRFQSIMWQAMLKSAELSPTKKVVYHGFINSGGQKMSKSLGNVISPYELVERYGTDATRYLLLRHVHPFEDTDITWERLDEWYTANLVNGLGNLTSRIMKLVSSDADFIKKKEKEYGIGYVDFALDMLEKESITSIENFNLQSSLDSIMKMVSYVDLKIQNDEAYKVIKTEPERAFGMIFEQMSDLRIIAKNLFPFLPDTSTKILYYVESLTMPESPMFPRLS